MSDKKTNPFKVGDKIRCIDDWNTYTTLGGIYTVTELDGDYVKFESDFGILNFALFYRFELVEETNDADKPNTFKVGDKVLLKNKYRNTFHNTRSEKLLRCGEVYTVKKVLADTVFLEEDKSNTGYLHWRFELYIPSPETNNGGSSDYYELPTGAKELADLIEHRNMNFNIGNIFKACYRLGNKNGVDELYDLNKIKWYVEREIARVSQP